MLDTWTAAIAVLASNNEAASPDRYDTHSFLLAPAGLFVAFRDLAVDPSVLTRKSLRVSDADAYDPRKSMRLERRADRFHDHFIRRWVERKYLTGEQHTLDIDKSAMPASILVWRK